MSKHRELKSPYSVELTETLASGFDPEQTAQQIYERMMMLPKADLEKNKSHILLELSKAHHASKGFAYETQKLLYQIKVHPATRERYAKCCEYLHRFYTQTQPPDMDYKEWAQKRLTEAKVLSYLRQALRKQNQKLEQDVIALVKKNDQFVYKAYSVAARRQLTDTMRRPIPVYQAVLDNNPEQYPGFERLLRRKHREYDNQSQAFDGMAEDPEIAVWLRDFTLWDAENEEPIHFCKSGMECSSGSRAAAKHWPRLRLDSTGCRSRGFTLPGWFPLQSPSETTGMWC